MPEDLTPQEGAEAPAPDAGPTDLTPQSGADAPDAGAADAAPGDAPVGKADGQADADKAGAPETYEDFTLPEGVEVDQVAMDAFQPLAKELGLSQEQAQKLVDIQAGMMEQLGTKLQAQLDEKVETWVETSKADKEIGGAEFDAKLATANEAVKQFGTKELLDVFDATGVRNHPEVIRFCYRIGKMMQNDKFEFGNTNKPGPKSAAEVLFPDMPKGDFF
jgi:hypothetical protein